MKKLSAALITLLSFFSVNSQNAIDLDLYYNLQLRSMLENLDPSLTQNEFLYEMAIHTIDTNEFSVLYDNIGNDTTGYNTWLE